MATKRATSEQMDFLVSLLGDRPANKREWDELAQSLNAIRFGTQKSGDRWQQSWRDLKTNAKKKASNIQVEMNRTGGGLVRFPPLTPLDEKVLAIMGRLPIDGLPEECTLYVTEIEIDAPTCQVVPQSPGPVLEEVISTGPVLAEIPATPGPSGIKRKASNKGLFGKRAISFDHRYLVATENTNHEREKLLLEKDELKLEEKKVAKMEELGAAMLASIAAERQEDAKFRDGILAELLKRKCSTNADIVTIKTEPGPREENGGGIDIILSDVKKDCSEGRTQTAGSINVGAVTIKTEPKPREDDEGGIPNVEIDIGLSDVKKDCLERKTQTADLLADLKKHSTRKQLSCPHCNYSCPGKARLELHLRIHTGEKPFSCSVCTYSFCQLSNLKRHMQTHCGEKPFSCSDCNYSFPQKGHLTRHMKTHSGKKPFSCSNCSYSCSQKGNLMRHMLIHSGKKPFACSKCNFTCSRKENLTCHMLTHSGEKPFSCSVCNYSCSRKGHLTRHMVIHSR